MGTRLGEDADEPEEESDATSPGDGESTALVIAATPAVTAAEGGFLGDCIGPVGGGIAALEEPPPPASSSSSSSSTFGRGPRYCLILNRRGCCFLAVVLENLYELLLLSSSSSSLLRSPMLIDDALGVVLLYLYQLL